MELPPWFYAIVITACFLIAGSMDYTDSKLVEGYVEIFTEKD